MKQVIFLGFYCQIYKKAPTARIYVGDVMIDEIEIPEYYTEEYVRDKKLSFLSSENVDNTFLVTQLHIGPTELDPSLFEKKHILDNFWWDKKGMSKISFTEVCKEFDPEFNTLSNIKHPKILVYVIDDEVLKTAQYKLRIEIKNSDSDYTNGFMSKSTLVYLSHFYMIPYTLFKDPINYAENFLQIFSRRSRSYNLQKILSYYRKKIGWPLNLNQHFMLVDNTGKQRKKLDPVFGGDAVLHITMEKKHGIYWAKSITPKGFFYLNRFFVKDFIVPLNNKYKQNENQGNTD
jgi:hypothetical protein